MYIVYKESEERRKREKRPDGQNFYTAAGQMSFADFYFRTWLRAYSLRVWGHRYARTNKLLPNLAIHERICLHGYARVNYSTM